MAASAKEVLSTGKVIWIEANGATSSPVRYVLEGSTLFVLADGAHEALPAIEDGDEVEVIGHPLSRQTEAGRAAARARRLNGENVPMGVLLDLAGTKYDASLTPDENFDALKGQLSAIALDI